MCDDAVVVILFLLSQPRSGVTLRSLRSSFENDLGAQIWRHTARSDSARSARLDSHIARGYAARVCAARAVLRGACNTRACVCA